jgi:hypothetical protein
MITILSLRPVSDGYLWVGYEETASVEPLADYEATIDVSVEYKDVIRRETTEGVIYSISLSGLLVCCS